MGEPDFSFEGIDENDCFYIKDGETVLNTVRQAKESRSFSAFEFIAYDQNSNDYFFECQGFVTMNRRGEDRLYFAVKDLEEEKNSLHGMYIVKNADGICLLVPETDEEMYDKLIAIFDGGTKAAETLSGSEKKSGKGWNIALKIILFPFWLIWQFIKALLSLFSIAAGDNSFVKGFKRGFNGEESPVKEYTFTNDMGCEQTVYSSNGRDFYSADGSFVGTSDDFGKTIKFKAKQ